MGPDKGFGRRTSPSCSTPHEAHGSSHTLGPALWGGVAPAPLLHVPSERPNPNKPVLVQQMQRAPRWSVSPPATVHSADRWCVRNARRTRNFAWEI